MKLLALISMGVAASYWYKTIKDSKPTLLKSNFDEIGLCCTNRRKVELF
ncbi:hypothetical protein [Acinetobacter baumannii]|nr:hypothetical protein [Acinetobacter baumannii]